MTRRQRVIGRHSHRAQDGARGGAGWAAVTGQRGRSSAGRNGVTS